MTTKSKAKTKVVEQPHALVLHVEQLDMEQEAKTSLLDSFKPMFDQFEDWKRRAGSIVVTDVSQNELMISAGTARKALKNIRVEVEKRRKSLKEESLRKGQNIDALAKLITNHILPIEEHLEKQEKFIEIKAEEEKQRKLIERIERLAPYNVIYNRAVIATMDDQMFDNYLDGVINAHNERIKKEKEDAEQARIQAERDAKERQRIEAENKKLREENEKVQMELKEKNDAEAKAKADAEAVLAMGDKDKFRALLMSLESNKQMYQFKTKKYQKLQVDVNGLIDKIIVWANQNIK